MKVYYIGRHIPSWLRSLAPKSALEVHEESWNAYPRTRTKFSVPFVEKFMLEVDTVFQPDGGTQVSSTLVYLCNKYMSIYWYTGQ